MTLFTPSNIAALIIASSFAAGLKVYATVLTLGLLARAHAVAPPPGLDVLGQWWVIGVSGAMFALEFIADKIPAFDMVWNALHTFIRPPVAALLAWQASAQLSPESKLVAALAGASIALDSCLQDCGEGSRRPCFCGTQKKWRIARTQRPGFPGPKFRAWGSRIFVYSVTS